MSHFFSHPTFKDMEIPNSNTELIGKGTFGIVKLAKSIKSNKHYALKIVKKQNSYTKK